MEPSELLACKVAPKPVLDCMFGGILFIADMFFYPLGFLLNETLGVFLPYSSFRGANLEDLTLFESELTIF